MRPYITALLYEHTKNYPISIYLGGGAIFGSALLMILPWLRMRRTHMASTVIMEVTLE